MSGEWTIGQLMDMAKVISIQPAGKKIDVAREKCKMLNRAGKIELAGILRSKYGIDISEVTHA